MKKRVISLLGGGIDSTVVTAHLVDVGYEVITLTFNYGQRNIGEVQVAERISPMLGVEQHFTQHLGFIKFDSALTNIKKDVPRNRSIEEIEGGIAPTYVPARNTMFLAYALGWAEQFRAEYIAVGADADESPHNIMPDCEPAYFAAFEKLASIATKEAIESGVGVQILTPVIKMLTHEIIQWGVDLGVDFSMTLSCYDPKFLTFACGECDACILRREGFKRAGVSDPTIYA